MKIYDYIRAMPRKSLILSITDEYYRIKGSFNMAPAMGVYSSFDFASALLIWKYSREHLKDNFNNIGEFMILLGTHIGCAYNCMPSSEWSDKFEKIINTNLLLSYDESVEIYVYMKENFADEIYNMEFNNGDKSMDYIDRMDAYYNFTKVYNSIPDYSSTLRYYEMQGLRIKEDMPFRINN